VSHAGKAVVGCTVFPATGDPAGVLYVVEGDKLVQAVDGLPLLQHIKFGPDDTLWIVGSTLAGGGFVATSDLSTAVVLEDQFDGPIALVEPINATDAVVAGTFTKVAAVDAANIAKMSGTTWTALADGIPGPPTALAHDDAHVYVSTFDDGFSGTGGYLLGSFDGTAWTELAGASANLTVVPDFNFNALRVVDDAIIAAGSAELDDKSGRGALVFRNGAFTPLGGGVHASFLSDIAITSDAIWFAGSTAEAGSGAGLVSTVGVASYQIDLAR
jgi:hypothetical protein